MNQKLLIIVSAIVLALTVGCSGNMGTGHNSGADSIYTWEHIRQLMMEEPERALGMVDTAEMRGLADVNYANQMRAIIYFSSPKVEDLDKAAALCLGILEESRGRQSAETENRRLACPYQLEES